MHSSTSRILSAQIPGGDLRKVAIASRIAKATMINMEWLNQKLKMKSAANVRQHLWRLKTKKLDVRRLPENLQSWIKINLDDN